MILTLTPLPLKRGETGSSRMKGGTESFPFCDEHHAMQCGYCTPGFVVTAKALLDRTPDPAENEVKEALAGNLCRCGTYPQHPKAVMGADKKL